MKNVRTGQVDHITELLTELTTPVVFGVRYIEQTVAYVVHGPPSAGFLDILSRVPAASEAGRTGRHARIELGRESELFAELINGYSLPAVEFVRLLKFPIQLVEVEVDVDDMDDDEDGSDEDDTDDEDTRMNTDTDEDFIIST